MQNSVTEAPSFSINEMAPKAVPPVAKISSTKSGKLKISGWIPVNENNPHAEMMAQKKITQELELLLLEDLFREYWLIES